jgi:hypothetical protein
LGQASRAAANVLDWPLHIITNKQTNETKSNIAALFVDTLRQLCLLTSEAAHFFRSLIEVGAGAKIHARRRRLMPSQIL